MKIPEKYFKNNRVIYVELGPGESMDYKKMLSEKQKSHVRREILDRKIRFVTDRKKNGKKHFTLTLIGLDGLPKYTQNYFTDFNYIFDLIDQMPMRKAELANRKHKKHNEENYGLYSDDNPNETIRGTGYKNKQKALQTLDIIKKAKPLRQKQIVNTMYNRAKHHKHQTKEMREAMEIFEQWLGKHNKPVSKDQKTW